MKNLVTLFLFITAFTINGQSGFDSVEIKTVSEITSAGLAEAKLMVWDSFDLGKVKYVSLSTINALDHVVVSTATYTLLEDDIKNGKPHVFTASNVVITIPEITYIDFLFVPIIHEGTGTIEIRAGTNVTFTDETLTTDYAFTLYSRADDIWRVWTQEVEGGGISGGVQSVTGTSIDNTDSANPVVNAIPITGTVLGNPLSGDIVFDSVLHQFNLFDDYTSQGLFIDGTDFNNDIFIGINTVGAGRIGVFEGTPYLNNNQGNTLTFITDRGLEGNGYWGASYTDNTYVQKLYVDTAISNVDILPLDNVFTGTNAFTDTVTINNTGGIFIRTNGSSGGTFLSDNLTNGRTWQLPDASGVPVLSATDGTITATGDNFGVLDLSSLSLGTLQTTLTNGSTYVGGFDTWDWSFNQLEHRNTNEGWGLNFSGEGLFFTDDTGSRTGQGFFESSILGIGNLNTAVGIIRTDLLDSDQNYELPNDSGTFVLEKNRETSSPTALKTINWSDYTTYDFTLTGLTSLIDSNLPTSVNTKDVEITSKGGYLNTPDIWQKLSVSENYIGAYSNFMKVDAINGIAGSEIIYYTNSVVKPTYDYIVDAVNGNDTNDGLTEFTAWASLSKIDKTLLVKGETISVLVKSGTYNTANDYLEIVSANDDVLDAVLNIEFEKGSVMDGTNMAGTENGVEQSGNIAWTLNVIGNGLDLNGYKEASAASPNGIGNRGVCTINIYDVHITDCEDGFSSHETAFMNIYNSSARECDKSAFIHVNSATINAYNSVFIEKIGGSTSAMSVTDSASTCAITATNCVFIADSNTIASKFTGTYNNCQIGTFDSAFTISTSNSNVPTFNNSFVNMYMDGQNDAVLSNCFGKFSTRVRTGGTLDVQNCVFVSPASGQTNMIFSNFNSGGSNAIVFNNNIIKASTGFMSVDATNSGYMVTAAAQFFNNSLFGGITYDSDLVTSDSGNTVIVGTVTTDPLIGVANTLKMADYAFTTGSPCIGAGTGGDIGFSESVIRLIGKRY